jgi:HPt (histidine-containing phosphotransfer) domain-containing protein
MATDWPYWKAIVRSTRRRRGAAATEGDTFEALRASFYARLKRESVHFVTLSAALARTEEDPAWIFGDLRDRAHKIRGSAAMFEIPDVAAAACALELASISATMTHANNGDAAVWTALVALVELLDTLDLSGAPTAALLLDQFHDVSIHSRS